MHARIDQLLGLRDGEPVDADVARHAAECHACAAELARLRQMQHRLQQLDWFDPPPMLSLDISRTRQRGNAGRRWIGWAVAAGGALAIAVGVAHRDHDPSAQQSAAVTQPIASSPHQATGSKPALDSVVAAQTHDRVAPQSTAAIAPESVAAGSTAAGSIAPGSTAAGSAAAASATPKLAAAPGSKREPAPLERLVAQSQKLDQLLLSLPERPSIERVALAGTIDTLEYRIQWLDEQLSYAPESGLNDSQAYRLWRERVDLMDSLVKVRYAEGQRLNF